MNITRFGIALTGAVLAVSALSGCSKVTELRAEATQMAEQVVATGTDQVLDAVSGAPVSA